MMEDELVSCELKGLGPQDYFAKRYREGDARWGRRTAESPDVIALRAEVERMVQRRGRVNLLDIGCGTMPVTIGAAAHLPSVQVLGVDWVADAILKYNCEFAAWIDNSEQFRIIGGDFLRMACAPAFDMVVDFGLLHHLEPQEWGVYRERLLAATSGQGVYMVECFSLEDPNWGKDRPGGHMRRGYYCHYFDLSTIRDLFGEWFRDIHEVACVRHHEHTLGVFRLTNG